MANMNPFPPMLFSLICASLCTSTVVLIFSALLIGTIPILWIIPAAFVATISHHATTLLIASAQPPSSPRLFSKANVACVYILTLLWGSAVGLAIALTVHEYTRKLTGDRPREPAWIMILSCVISLVELAITIWIAVVTQKERKRIAYAEKWKWRPNPATSSQWRCVLMTSQTGTTFSQHDFVVLAWACRLSSVA